MNLFTVTSSRIGYIQYMKSGFSSAIADGAPLLAILALGFTNTIYMLSPYHSLLNLSCVSSHCPDLLLPAERVSEHMGNMNATISNIDVRLCEYHLDVIPRRTNPAVSQFAKADPPHGALILSSLPRDRERNLLSFADSSLSMPHSCQILQKYTILENPIHIH